MPSRQSWSCWPGLNLRYGIYYTPAGSAGLTSVAARWLGRDAFTNAGYQQRGFGAVTEPELHELTSDARRYGFHATLKAPFALAQGRSEEELVASLEDFAAATPAFDIPEVVVGRIGNFFAIVPSVIHDPLQEFAASVVETFEPFRAALSPADIARRNPDRLSPAHRANLERWGYPYVMEEFRFHMTLTGQIPEELADDFAGELENRFSPFHGRSLHIGAIALFIEPERGHPFTVCRHIELAKTTENGKIAS